MPKHLTRHFRAVDVETAAGIARGHAPIGKQAPKADAAAVDAGLQDWRQQLDAAADEEEAHVAPRELLQASTNDSNIPTVRPVAL